MKNEMLDFLLMRDPNVRLVVSGTVMICVLSAITGCFTFLRKRSLAGDAIAHSVLPGICLAFMISGDKHPVLLMTGAIVTGLISLMLMEAITRARLARPDTAIALMLSVFFGAGIVLLTSIQHSGNASQAGLDKYLLGKAASITSDDLRLIGISALVILAVILVFFRGFYLISFDEAFALSAGFPVKLLQGILSVITVWTIAIGIQSTGVVLMAALLVSPPLAARMWTDSIVKMLLLAGLIGSAAGYFGALVSYTAPAMPTGPWIVVMATMIAAFSLAFAPQRGLVSRWALHQRNRTKSNEENILKLFYKLMEKDKGDQAAFLEEDLLNHRPFRLNILRSGLKSLVRKNQIKRVAEAYTLTAEGRSEAERIVRLHRLWELYLQKYLHLNPDHVHDDAEAIEHVITPEIEYMLDLELGFPDKDPHETLIPPSSR
jgi:manganese/zinc/iron transport system permease protein